MRNLSPAELADTIDDLWDEAESFHPWHEPGVTSTDPIPLDAPIDHDGINRAYAMASIDGSDPEPAAITVDETHLVVAAESGGVMNAALDDIDVTVQSWTRLEIAMGTERCTLEFLDDHTSSRVRSRKAMAAALGLVTTVGLGGVAAMNASAHGQFRLAFARFPMLYRHLQRHAAGFTPMPWWHHKRVLYSTIGSISSLIFIVAIPVFFVISVAVPAVFVALSAGPALRDGLDASDLPVVFLSAFFSTAFAALLQGLGLACASVHIPMLVRGLSGRASPAERPAIASFEYGNAKTGGLVFLELGKVVPNWMLLVSPLTAVGFVSVDVARQGETGLATGRDALIYYGAILIASAVGVAYVWRFALVSRSALLNKLAWVHDHRHRDQTVLVWDNAKVVIAVAIATAILVLAIPPLFVP